MNNIGILKEKKLFVLDMDGTFYLEDNIIEGSLEFLKKVGDTGREFIFFTNNSSKNSAFYKKRLSNMGCQVDESRIITSGDVTIDYVKNNYPQSKVYLMGTTYLKDSFEKAGIVLVEEDPDLVVVGFDTSLDFEKVTRVCTYIDKGCPFIATHLDVRCPTHHGFIPDCGAICAMITAATDKKPKYLGKPFNETIEAILNKTGYKKEDICFVGDRLYTDIAIGFNNGVTSILVLSGETKAEDVAFSKIKPDFIFKSLGHIAELL